MNNELNQFIKSPPERAGTIGEVDWERLASVLGEAEEAVGIVRTAIGFRLMSPIAAAAALCEREARQQRRGSDGSR